MYVFDAEQPTRNEPRPAERDDDAPPGRRAGAAARARGMRGALRAPGGSLGPGAGHPTPRRDLSATALHDAACVCPRLEPGPTAVQMCNDTRDAARARERRPEPDRGRGGGALLAGAGPPGGGWAGPAGVTLTAVHVQRRWQRATPLTGARAHLVTARSCRVRGADAVVSTCMQGAHLVTARSCRIRKPPRS